MYAIMKQLPVGGVCIKYYRRSKICLSAEGKVIWVVEYFYFLLSSLSDMVINKTSSRKQGERKRNC